MKVQPATTPINMQLHICPIKHFFPLLTPTFTHKTRLCFYSHCGLKKKNRKKVYICSLYKSRKRKSRRNVRMIAHFFPSSSFSNVTYIAEEWAPTQAQINTPSPAVKMHTQQKPTSWSAEPLTHTHEVSAADSSERLSKYDLVCQSNNTHTP